MKNATIHDVGAPREGELELINRLTRRPFTADEVYTFSITLCDNEVDRDFERFTEDALNKLAGLFVGKTGIFDHSMKGRDQIARVFSCEVKKEPGVFTRDGQPYTSLCARAYMPRTDKNRDVILDIDAGITKEVSVGCSVARQSCSICGADRKTGCAHKNGRFYKKDGRKQLCHTILDEPTDAYEWSFVAVPAQPKAGITKAFGDGFVDADDKGAAAVLKGILSAAGISSDTDNCEVLKERLESHMSELSSMAAMGREYINELKAKAFAAFAAHWTEIPADLASGLIDRLSPGELSELAKSAARANSNSLGRPQTARAASAGKAADNQDFLI